MDWESRFTSLVRDTEANLAKIRNRLVPDKSFTTMTKFHSHPIPDYGKEEASAWNLPLVNNNYPELPYLHNQTENKTNASASSIQLLEEKVDFQAKLIDDLVKSVKQLQSTKTEQQLENKALQALMECDLKSLSRTVKDVTSKTDFFDKHIKKLGNKIESQKHKNEESESEKIEIQNQLKHLRLHIRNLKDRLNSMDIILSQEHKNTTNSLTKDEHISQSISGDDGFDLSSDLIFSDDDSTLTELFSDGHAADVDSSESYLLSSDSESELRNF